MDLSPKTLEQKNRAELEEIMNALKIQIDPMENDATCIAKIRATGEYNLVKERSGATSMNNKGERIHKRLGKYYKVIVHPTDPMEQKTSIFAAINIFTFEFQPKTEVELPAAIIKMLKAPSRPEHYFDKNAISENGNVGAHLTRYVPGYIVERVD